MFVLVSVILDLSLVIMLRMLVLCYKFKLMKANFWLRTLVTHHNGLNISHDWNQNKRCEKEMKWSPWKLSDMNR